MGGGLRASPEFPRTMIRSRLHQAIKSGVQFFRQRVSVVLVQRLANARLPRWARCAPSAPTLGAGAGLATASMIVSCLLAGLTAKPPGLANGVGAGAGSCAGAVCAALTPRFTFIGAACWGATGWGAALTLDACCGPLGIAPLGDSACACGWVRLGVSSSASGPSTSILLLSMRPTCSCLAYRQYVCTSSSLSGCTQEKSIRGNAVL